MRFLRVESIRLIDRSTDLIQSDPIRCQQTSGNLIARTFTAADSAKLSRLSGESGRAHLSPPPTCICYLSPCLDRLRASQMSSIIDGRRACSVSLTVRLARLSASQPVGRSDSADPHPQIQSDLELRPNLRKRHRESQNCR